MANTEDTSTIQPTAKQWTDAEQRIQAYLEKHSDGEDIAPLQDSAFSKWLRKQHVLPELHAKRALQDHRKKAAHRRDLEFANPGVAERLSMGGHEANAEVEGRVRRYSSGEEVELRADVVSHCGEEFQKRFGFAWNHEWDKWVLTPEDRSADETEALEVLRQLRLAMERAQEFVDRPRRRGTDVPLGLGWWVPRHISPLVTQTFVRDREHNLNRAPNRYKEALRRFVATWDAYNIMDLPPRRDGRGSRVLDGREFAVVWFLGGGWLKRWPPKEWPAQGFSVLELVAKQEDTVRKALQKVGKQYIRGPEAAESDSGTRSA